MYLTLLREARPTPGNWPNTTAAHPMRKMLFDRCYEILDATLNSWERAHLVFKGRLKASPYGKDLPVDHVDHGTLRRMVDLVVKALQCVEDAEIRNFGIRPFPRETLAYVLIQEWARQEAA